MVTQILIVIPGDSLSREYTKRTLLEAGKVVKHLCSPDTDIQYREMDVDAETLAMLLRQREIGPVTG